MSQIKLQSGFGERLARERKRLKMTQAEFAEKADIKRVTQYLYEKELSNPNYEYFKKVSEAGVDLVFLFFNKKEVSQKPDLSLNTLKEIFTVVDERGRNKKGKPLSLEDRLEFFTLLCVSMSGRDESSTSTHDIANLVYIQNHNR